MEELYSFIKNIISYVQKDHEFPIIYKGNFNHELAKYLANSTKELTIANDIEPSLQRKIYHASLELLQNIYKHGSRDDDINKEECNGIFAFLHNDNKYVIITGNKVNEQQMNDLTNQIDQLNTMDAQELKSLYKQQMREGELSEKGGAGLGFIDIIRKTGSKLQYSFIQSDDNLYYFINQLEVGV